MNYSECRSFLLEGILSPESESDDYPNSRPTEAVIPRLYEDELSALRSILPKHPDVVDAVARATATILSPGIRYKSKPTELTLLHVLRRRIAADLKISLALYHGELCVQSTVQLKRDLDRVRATDHDNARPPVICPDHPLRQTHMSFEALLSRDDAMGEDHPATHHFVLRIPKSVKRFSSQCHYERDIHLAFDEITRDLVEIQALNERINRWCGAIRALENAIQARGSCSSVSTARVDACVADVAALAEVLKADVEEDGSMPAHLGPKREVYIGSLLVVRPVSGGKQPRRQLALRPPERRQPLSERRLGQSQADHLATVPLTNDWS